ncbi:MAG: extracellular solute-binding protein [Bifidobacterium sp.]|jgi:multiple sugar transport system substrate-binding protein|nr:extracellular solute-binding protein [Bifidobacterium sp.]MCI1865219.1 extracellular solute-binding protein [Bifidobacterium sp.]
MMKTHNRAMMLSAAAFSVVALLAGCGSGGFDAGPQTASGALTSNASKELTVLIASSGDPETQAVTTAVQTWASKNGRKAKVTVANDLNQQLSQGFASGSPADVFYLAPEQLAGYASNGSLLAYGDRIGDRGDYYPSLLQSLTYKGKLYAIPKDVSTLQLVINDTLWKQAGLTNADYPKSWKQLESVARRLTTSEHKGLVFTAEYARVGVFMAQAGGGLVSKDGTKATASSRASIAGLTEARRLLTSGSAAYASDLGAGWGGEALGTGKAAMAIEGNWVAGAFAKDYPALKYDVIPLPAGPAGKGTMQFTNGWGIAADSPDQQGSISLVRYLSSDACVMQFAKAFGIMPGNRKLAAQWKTEYPRLAAFSDGLDYSIGVPTLKGASTVVADFNSQLAQLRTVAPETILDKTQTNLDSLIR